MFFTTKEIVHWLGLTVFEIWINLISFLAFTILLAIKFEPEHAIFMQNWGLIFFPLYAGDALNAYFCVIVFIRMVSEVSVRASLLRVAWSGTFLFLTFLFKVFLCKKLLGQLNLDYSEVFAPVYILLQLVAVRACQQS